MGIEQLTGRTSAIKGEEVVHSLLNVALFLLQGSGGSILMLDKDKYLQLRYAKGYNPGDFTFAPGEGVAGWVAQTGEPALVPDVKQDHRYLWKVSPLIDGKLANTLICVPIFYHNQVIGVVSIDRLGLPFREEELEQLREVVKMMEKVFQDSQLVTQVTIDQPMLAVNYQLDDLTQVLQELHMVTGKDELGPIFLNNVQALYKQADSGFLVMIDDEATGLYQFIARFGSISLGQEPCSKITNCSLLAKQKAFIFNKGADNIFEDDCLLKDYEASSIMLAPLVLDEKLMGVMVVGSVFPRVFSEQDLKMFKTLANQTSMLYRAGVIYSDLKYYADYIVNGVVVGVICLDLHNRITLVNQVAEKILGIPKEKLIGKKYTEYGDYIDLNVIEEGTRKMLATGEPVEDLKVMTCPEKHTTGVSGNKMLELNMNILRNRKGSAIGIIISFEDITEKLMMEEQLRRAERLLVAGQLAAGAAHEIKNPLTTIKGFIQLLLSTISTDDVRANYLDTMLAEVKQINRIIDEMDGLVKTKLDQVDWVDISSLIEEVLREERRDGRLAKLKVHTVFDSHISPVFGDIKKLKQVFYNILSNSIEATPNGGGLIIQVSGGDIGEVVIRFSDTGMGISQEDLEQIYNPFFTSRPEAIGLGLPISYKTVREHGGTMEIASKLGEGTEVTIKMPINFSFGDILQS